MQTLQSCPMAQSRGRAETYNEETVVVTVSTWDPLFQSHSYINYLPEHGLLGRQQGLRKRGVW